MVIWRGRDGTDRVGWSGLSDHGTVMSVANGWAR